jgi:hypothetical protein
MKFLHKLLNGVHDREIAALRERSAESRAERQAATKKLVTVAESIIRKEREESGLHMQRRFRKSGAL